MDFKRGKDRLAAGGWRLYYRDGSSKYVINAWYLDEDGRMATELVVLTPDQDGALQYQQHE